MPKPKVSHGALAIWRHQPLVNVAARVVQIDGLLVKGDIALSGGGLLVRLPRSMARGDVNRLLASLEQPPLPA